MCKEGNTQKFVSGVFKCNTWSQFSDDVKAVCANDLDNDTTNDDIDEDNDGLIELCYLEDLDAMRHVSTGTGYIANEGAAKVTTGCPSNGGCKGYELVRSLDFEDVNSYRDGAINTDWTTTSTGWVPVPFDAIFEGNGHTLSGLLIGEGNDRAGLFSNIGTKGRVRNIGLLDVNLKGVNVGGLSGRCEGHIINSYATGTSVAAGSNTSGGLVGTTTQGGRIFNSYATVSVEGLFAGGLVGLNVGAITNSYAMGIVAGSDDAGGLVGLNISGNIIKSYATGAVTGGDTGGLIGRNSQGFFIDKSYWDTETSTPTSAGVGAEGKTTTELQMPTAPGRTEQEVYYQWNRNSDDWDFGLNMSIQRSSMRMMMVAPVI